MTSSYVAQPQQSTIKPTPVTRISCGGGGGVLTRPKWTKLPKCIFDCLIHLFGKVAVHEKFLLMAFLCKNFSKTNLTAIFFLFLKFARNSGFVCLRCPHGK